MVKVNRAGATRTFARFLRHSVHALGVTTPSPLRLFENDWVGIAAAEAGA